MDYTIRFDAPAEKMYQDLTSRDYWETLIEVYQQFTPSRITSYSSTEAGTDIVTVQEIPRSELPAVARAVIPADMVITRKQHFEPYDNENNSAVGSYSASIPKGPGRFGGRYFLRETRTGSELQLASECKVWIPLVGGALEDLVLQNIRHLFDGEEAFAADWISKHH
jgi:hypothetical protein